MVTPKQTFVRSVRYFGAVQPINTQYFCVLLVRSTRYLWVVQPINTQYFCVLLVRSTRYLWVVRVMRFASMKISCGLSTIYIILPWLEYVFVLNFVSEQKVSVVDLSIHKLGQIPHVACAQLLSKLLQKIDAPDIVSASLRVL